jgi:hypothetical protein
MTRAEGISVLASIRGDLGAFSLRCPRAHAGRADGTRHPKRFSVSAAVWLLGCRGRVAGILHSWKISLTMSSR